MEKATLVVMAAGMGSRFGGLKQLEPVGEHGEVLLDYSVYDAKRAGFDKVVFIIKKSIEKDFRETAGDRISRGMEVEYVFQEIPEHRKKPYGTGDAILRAADAVSTPFAVINADDFYGADAFMKIREGLRDPDDYCMVGYRLANTLSDNGSVSRGVCDIKDGCLADINEQAEELFSRLVKQLSEKEGVTETLKAENQMLWAQKMNSLRNSAMEIVSNELIYR